MNQAVGTFMGVVLCEPDLRALLEGVVSMKLACGHLCRGLCSMNLAYSIREWEF